MLLCHRFLLFLGSLISVIGIIPNGSTLISANYTIDNGRPFVREETGLEQGASLGHQILFQMDGFKQGQHTLRIDAINATSDRPYFITSFQVCEGPTPAHKPQTKTIVIAVVGGTGFLLLIFVSVWLYIRRRRRGKGKLAMQTDRRRSSLGKRT